MARIARLGIQIDSSGAKRGADETNRALSSIDQTAQRTVKELQKVAATLGVAFGVRAIVQAVDTYAQLDARLRQVTGTTAAYSAAQQALFRIAQDSRSSFTATVDLYTRLARSSEQLGLSQGQLVSVTEAVSNAVRLSNASTQAAEAGLIQLGQAFASGTLRGDELRSIMEQLPGVAKAIADGLGVPIGRLREMGEAGQLSAQRVAQALDSQRERLALLAGEIPTTIGQALVQLNNAFGMVVAGSNEARSASGQLAQGLGEAARLMVEYKDAVVALSVALGAGGLVLAASKAAAALSATAFGGAVVAFVQLLPAVNSVSAAMALLRVAAGAAWTAITGPVGIAITAITAVAGAVYLWRKRKEEILEPTKRATQATEDLYAAAKRLAGVNWVPTSMLDRLRELGGQLAAVRAGGKDAGDAFAMASEEWKRSAGSTKDFAQALADGDTKAKSYFATARATVALQGQVTQVTESQTKAQKDAAKAAEDRRKAEEELAAAILASSLDVWDKLRQAEQEAAEARREGARLVAASIADRGRELQQTNELITALRVSRQAYEDRLTAQAMEAAVREALITAGEKGLRLDILQLAVIADQVKQLRERLRLLGALKDVDLEGLFTLPDAKQTQSWADGLRDVLGVVQLIASAFGLAGEEARSLAQATTGAQSIVSGLASAGNIRGSDGKRVTFGNAVSGNAGIGAMMSAFGSAGQIAAGALQIADALDLFGNRARERARQLAEQARAFNRALEDFAIVQRTDLQSQLRGNLQRANQVASAGGMNATFGSVAEISAAAEQFRAMAEALSRETEPGAAKAAARFRSLADQLSALADVTRDNEAALIAQNKAAVARLTEDLGVRRLVAQGLTEAAEAERLRLQQIREVQEAEERFGKDSPYLDELKKVQEAETAAAEATRTRLEAEKARQQAFDRTQFGLDLTGRRQTLNGDSRGAFVTQQTIQQNSALAQAQQLVEAGTITAAMFEELKTLLGDELTAAIQAFDAAAAESVLQQREDLQVRALVAQGRGKEAETLRREIANRRELEGVTDEALRAQILYVQGLELAAQVMADAAAEQAAMQDQLLDIDRRTIEALRILDPEQAKALEAKQREADRAKELAGAANDMIRARLEELYALQDAAAAQAALTEELKSAADAAQRLADFSSDLETQWLRATGRGFDADVKALNDWRTAQLKNAAAFGLLNDPETLRRIQETYDANYAKLVADMMGGAAGGGRADPFRDPAVRYSNELAFNATSESTALRMLDVQLSQLTVLRSIDSKAGAGGAGGIVIQVTVSGSPIVAQTPEQLGQDLARAILPALDEWQGRKVGVEKRRSGSPALS